ncbi:hypothetical protein BGZ58_006796, partial [Dissophora ornata]
EETFDNVTVNDFNIQGNNATWHKVDVKLCYECGSADHMRTECQDFATKMATWKMQAMNRPAKQPVSPRKYQGATPRASTTVDRPIIPGQSYANTARGPLNNVTNQQQPKAQ